MASSALSPRLARKLSGALQKLIIGSPSCSVYSFRQAAPSFGPQLLRTRSGRQFSGSLRVMSSVQGQAKGIPIVSYGRREDVAKAIAKALEPEYDVVHMLFTLPVALTELPLLLTSDTSSSTTTLPAPSSNLGTNTNRPPSQRRSPQAVVCGGGIPESEVESLKREVQERCGQEAVEGVLWVKVDPEEVRRVGGPSVQSIVPILRRELGKLEVGN